MNLLISGAYYFIAMVFAYYFGKTYFEEHDIEYSYEAGYMCMVAPILGLFWPVVTVFGIVMIIARRIL